MTLDEISVGTTVVVESIDYPNGALKKRFLEMGFTPGVTIKLIKVAPLGNPIEIMIRGYELTLRKEEASKIQVKVVKKPKHPQKITKDFTFIEHPKIGELPPEEFYDTNSMVINGTINLALVGNPNAGKTTLFNKLTGSNYR